MLDLRQCSWAAHTRAVHLPAEVLQQVGDFVGGSEMRREVDKSMRSLAQSALARLDVVNREEFDAQADLLRRTRAKVTALEAELADLTAELERLANRDSNT